nr:MAG TPA: hypothetical protein [Caudoviricetes sp.]
MTRKSGAMYVYITDFSLQYQGPKKTGTELGTAGRAPVPCADAVG